MFEHHGDIARHFAAHLLIVRFGKFSALVFKIQILNISEQNFLSALQKIPFGFFDDGRFQSIVLAKQRNADRSENTGTEDGANNVGHQSSGVKLWSSSS